MSITEDGLRLHLAVTRLYVLVLYRPFLQPVLRWFLSRFSD